MFFDLVGQGAILNVVGAKNYISYLLVGIAVGGYVGTALFGASNEIAGELVSGQIEYVFSCPVSRYDYIVGNAFAQIVVATFSFVPLILLAIYYSGTIAGPLDLILSWAVVVVQLLLLVQLGAIFAGLVLVYKQISAAFGLLNMVFLLFSGTFFPLQVLPKYIQNASLAVPTTTGLDLLRHYLLGTTTIVSLEWEWLAILLELSVFAALAIFVIRHLEKSWKAKGLSYI